MSMIYGFFGTLVVGGLLAIGAALGWRSHEQHVARTTPTPPEVDEMELKRLIEEQAAFNMMQNYSAERAYGLTGGDRYDR